jgi:hypothetical protein
METIEYIAGAALSVRKGAALRDAGDTATSVLVADWPEFKDKLDRDLFELAVAQWARNRRVDWTAIFLSAEDSPVRRELASTYHQRRKLKWGVLTDLLSRTNIIETYSAKRVMPEETLKRHWNNWRDSEGSIIERNVPDLSRGRAADNR